MHRFQRGVIENAPTAERNQSGFHSFRKKNVSGTPRVPLCLKRETDNRGGFGFIGHYIIA
jgi:hypothetical protein